MTRIEPSTNGKHTEAVEKAAPQKAKKAAPKKAKKAAPQKAKRARWSCRLEVQPPNGRSALSTIIVTLPGGRSESDKADLDRIPEQEKLAKRLGKRLKKDPDQVWEKISKALQEARQQAAIANEQAAQTEAAPALMPEAVAGEYLILGGVIHRRRETPAGPPVLTPLCNFRARIVEEVARDNLVSRAVSLAVEGNLADGRQLPRVDVSGADFAVMNWILPHWGTLPVVYAGLGTKDHLRTAIQLFSLQGGALVQRIVYTHLGWRRHGERWVYLHLGGAISADGNLPDVPVELPHDLRHYILPDPPTGPELITAVRASLACLAGLAGANVVYPLLATVYRAALGDTDFGVHLLGRTGTFKTELLALAEQHYGPAMDVRHLPANWSSTGNALENIAFDAKDAVLAVDDFAPCGGSTDIARAHKEADRILRAQGNHSGRQRMRSGGGNRETHSPRGLILSTGEERPRGHSLQARLQIIEVAPEDVKAARLTECQRDAASGLYAQSMAGFLKWVAPRYEDVKAKVRTLAQKLRDGTNHKGRHRRTASITGELLAGWNAFLEFAEAAGAISPEERNTYWNAAVKAMGDVAERQAAYHETADPARQFVRLLSAVLSSGRAYLEDVGGGMPVPGADAYGWRQRGTEAWFAEGRRIGWVAMDGILLEPEAAFAEVQRLASEQGESLPVGPTTLWKRLHEHKLLAVVDEKRNRLTIRRTVCGTQHTVLCLSNGAVPAQETVQTVQTVQQET
jgi:hypothetical protein